mgnify:CR=1 FL=1
MSLDDSNTAVPGEALGGPGARHAGEERYMIELGRRIRAHRERARLTQQTLARMTNVACDMISRLENGHYTSPGLRTLLRIAEGLEITVGDLLPEHVHGEDLPHVSTRLRLRGLLDELSVEELGLIVELVSSVIRHRER